MKRLVAYTSVSHMGFVLLGIYAWNTLALQGAVVQMLAHGLSTGALFILVGALQERLHTRDMRQHGRAVGDAHRASARSACSSQSPRSGCPGSAISSANSWFCSAPIASPAGSRSPGSLGAGGVHHLRALLRPAGLSWRAAATRCGADRLLIAPHAPSWPSDDRDPRLARLLSAAGLRHRWRRLANLQRGALERQRVRRRHHERGIDLTAILAVHSCWAAR